MFCFVFLLQFNYFILARSLYYLLVSSIQVCFFVFFFVYFIVLPFPNTLKCVVKAFRFCIEFSQFKCFHVQMKSNILFVEFINTFFTLSESNFFSSFIFEHNTFPFFPQILQSMDNCIYW